MGPWLLAGAANGFVAVAMGAFAAHGLKAMLDPAALAWVETGSRYELTHALALVAVALLMRDASGASRQLLQASGLAFLLGSILFAGSLYLLALTGIMAMAWLTPLGGVSLLIGWAVLAWYGCLCWRGRPVDEEGNSE
jgi:uncharacterized membrane protein YgdD (TMEM256/DUF423 family)